ncbi:MAG: hypothetical protein ABSH47_11355 [Bryobacteraceae bacterium]|jgi:hypothetical protein
MDAPDIDLSREQAGKLEDTQMRFGAIWRRQHLRHLGVAALYAAAPVLFVLMAYFVLTAFLVVLSTMSHPPPPGSFAETVEPPRWAAWAMLWVFAVILVLQARAPFKMLMLEPSPACWEPEDTIRQYFESFLEAIAHASWRPGPWVQAWVCVLDQVKDRYYDYRDFVESSQKSGGEIRNLLQCAALRKLGIEASARGGRFKLSWEGQSGPFKPYRPLGALTIEAMAGSGGLIPYRVATTFQVEYDPERGGALRCSIPVVLTATLAQVGERWYVAAPPSGETGVAVDCPSSV